MAVNVWHVLLLFAMSSDLAQAQANQKCNVTANYPPPRLIASSLNRTEPLYGPTETEYSFFQEAWLRCDYRYCCNNTEVCVCNGSNVVEVDSSCPKGSNVKQIECYVAFIERRYDYQKCAQGYVDNGQRGCVKLVHCAEASASCSQLCTRGVYGDVCSCRTGYTQVVSTIGEVTCNDIDECATNTSGCKYQCVNTPGSFKCLCPAGYALESTDNKTCHDINECQTTNNSCSNICLNTIGSYTCACPGGMQLAVDDHVCHDIDECAMGVATCSQGCVNSLRSYTCSCRPGYHLMSDGSTCQDINECAINNGGCSQICANTAGSVQCSCKNGFQLGPDGKDCVDVNECDLRPCSNSCVNTPGSFHCACPPGYTIANDGLSCQDSGTVVYSNSSSTIINIYSGFWIYILIGIGVLLLLVLIALMVFCCHRRRKTRDRKHSPQRSTSVDSATSTVGLTNPPPPYSIEDKKMYKFTNPAVSTGSLSGDSTKSDYLDSYVTKMYVAPVSKKAPSNYVSVDILSKASSIDKKKKLPAEYQTVIHIAEQGPPEAVYSVPNKKKSRKFEQLGDGKEPSKVPAKGGFDCPKNGGKPSSKKRKDDNNGNAKKRSDAGTGFDTVKELPARKYDVAEYSKDALRMTDPPQPEDITSSLSNMDRGRKESVVSEASGTVSTLTRAFENPYESLITMSTEGAGSYATSQNWENYKRLKGKK